MVDKNKALEMREEGKTLREIGEFFGVSRQRIDQLIGKTVDLKYKNLKETVINLRNSRKSMREIGDLTGVSFSLMKKLAGDKWLKSCLEPVPEGFKRCYGCKQNIPVENFYENSTRCIDCTKKHMHDYIIKNKKKIRKYYRDQYKEDPNKTYARQAVKFALKQGKIIKGECQVKDKNCRGRIEAHHYLGYEKEHWLDIEWYCSYHHRHIDGLTWGKR